MLLTKMLTCTAARPTVAGAISPPIWRSPGSPGAHTGRKRQPSRRSDGTWIRNCARPPASVPSAQPSTIWSGLRPIRQSTTAHAIVTTLKSAGDSAGMPKRPSALSMPIATAANETSGRKGIITRVSRTVSSAFPGASSKPGAIVATSGQARAMASEHHQAEHDGQEAQDAVGEPEAGLLPALLPHPRIGRQERGRQRPLGKEIPEQVRDAEADPEGVGVVARPQESREHLLAHEAEEPGDERHGGHEPRRLREVDRLGLRLDLQAVPR